MGQVTTVREIKAHQTTVNRHQGLVDLQVGRAAGKRLDVDPPLGRIEAESLEGALLAKQLDLVNVLIATIVTGARQTLGVFVGHGRAKGVEHSARGNILRSDEDDGLPLALDLVGLNRRESEASFDVAAGVKRTKRTMIWATSGSVSRRDFSSICTSSPISHCGTRVDHCGVRCGAEL